MPYLGFYLGAEVYGLPLDQLREVARVSHLRRVPGAPAGVAGLVNLRGEILCALDVREILGLPAQASTDSPFLVALRGFGDPLGLIVDSIADIYAVPAKRDRTAARDLARRARRVFHRHRTRAGRTDGAARPRAGDEGMTASVSLLVFEAADCLMAVRVRDRHLEGSDPRKSNRRLIWRVFRRDRRPWLRWDAARSAWLRVRRVVDVVLCATC